MGTRAVKTVLALMLLFQSVTSLADSQDSSSNAIQPCKKNYLLLSTNQGSEDRCDAKSS